MKQLKTTIFLLSILSIDYNAAQCQSGRNGPCKCVCPNSTALELHTTVNIRAGLVGLFSHNKKLGMAMDVTKNLQFNFNGTGCGEYTASNITANIAIYYKCSPKGWFANKESFPAFIQRHSTLAGLIDPKIKGKVVSIDDKIPEIQKFVGGIVILFDSNYAKLLKATRINALRLLINLASSILQYRFELNEFFQILTNVKDDKISGEMLSISADLQGMGCFGSVIEGGIKTLADKKITFDYEQVVAAPTTGDVLVKLISTVTSKIDLNVLFGNTFKDPLRLTNFINEFNLAKGFPDALYHCVALISHNTTLHNFITSLIDFVSTDEYNNQNISLKEEWTKTFISLNNATSGYNGSLLPSIVNQNFIVNDVNVSEIIEILYLKGSINGLELIVKVLILLKNFTPLKETICHLIINTFLLTFLPDIGIRQLHKLDPDFDLSKINTSLASTDRNSSVSEIISNDDSLKFFEELTLIWKITLDINSALEAEGLSIQKIFNSTKESDILEQLIQCLIFINHDSIEKRTTASTSKDSPDETSTAGSNENSTGRGD